MDDRYITKKSRVTQAPIIVGNTRAPFGSIMAVKMEIMEDGNLVDRVRVLLQRDMEYYQVEQTVLREPLCVGVCGGRLDFPRHASFAAIKIVKWWEVEFTAAFKRTSGLSSAGDPEVSAGDSGAVVKNFQPSEFIMLLVDTAEQLLEHLHALAQEALDHADLTVLTATLGAGALVRNCLWCYSQQIKNEVSAQSNGKMCKCYKSFQEMAEALAERLLDLHCRLISLYILNEADSIDLQSNKPFFEKERCSFMIQMWWLYMKGTREDLWNTVPPKMAQRIFSGILNESLTIISTRFIHVFREGWSNLMVCLPEQGPAPWFSMSAPYSLLNSSHRGKCLNDLLDGQAIAYELIVLKAQPQPDWEQLINVLLMRSCKVSKLLFHKLVRDCAGREVDASVKKRNKATDINDCCGGFLCSEHACHQISNIPETVLCSLIHIAIISAWDPSCIIVPALEQDSRWYWALERQQTGASSYQAMSLVLACFGELHSCAPFGVLLTAFTMNDSLPAHCHPIAGSVILQLLCAALYSVLLSSFNDGINPEHSNVAEKSRSRVTIFDPNDLPASAMALAEALCSIDEDDKHTAEIDVLLDLIKESMATRNRNLQAADLESVPRVVETFVDDLSFTHSGRRSLKAAHGFLVQSSDWILSHLEIVKEEPSLPIITIADCSTKATPTNESILHMMFHIGHRSFDEFMTGFMETDWPKVLRIPLSITIDHIRGQILTRPEYKFPAQMTVDEREAAEAIKQLCVSVKSSHVN